MRTGSPVPIGRCIVRDHAFRFATHADVFPQKNSTTHGVLWDLDDSQLASLDAREGYPVYYDRKIVKVECGGKIYNAWMYYMTPGHKESPPSDYYYSMLDRGYKTFGVPLSQIETALKRSIENYSVSQNNKNGKKFRQTRWFESYTSLLRVHVGKRRLAEIRREAESQCLSLESLCEDYVEYGVIAVPDHFQVVQSECSKI